ncbi:hypothetical protein [Demequina activiva]|uniref:DUF4253 domain-containing protein n=1 Tax=Demequina activiva TaxID=1582364 RepID=A0A919Q4V7_9MICO|nr:hypothetical protein [Demequina activiva]GIG54936.1 hypothetical protein Dac01nite_16880 [Demequina activiva]
MISHLNPGFELACSVKRGDSTLPAAFTTFATVFEREFVARPLAVDLELLLTGRGPLLVARVWIEREAAIPHLRGPDGRYDGYVDFMERRRHELPRMFAQHTDATAFAPYVRRKGVEVEDLAQLPQSVYLCEFEVAAIQAVHDAVGVETLRSWGASLGLGDDLWLVTSMGGAPPVVFVQTAAQATQLRSSGALVQWRDAYFALASAYDEFHCLEVGSCAVRVDSRETFETLYGSSWYQYWH